jgi:hypothetical protein
MDKCHSPGKRAGDVAVMDRRAANENGRKWFSMIAGSVWHCRVASPASNFYNTFHFNSLSAQLLVSGARVHPQSTTRPPTNRGMRPVLNNGYKGFDTLS